MKGKHLDYLNSKLVEKVRELSKTHTKKDVILELGLSAHKLRMINEINGIRFDNSKPKLSASDVKDISDLVLVMSVSDIAEKYGVCYRYMYSFMKKNGIHLERIGDQRLGIKTLADRVNHKDAKLIERIRYLSNKVKMHEAAKILKITITQLRDVAHENDIFFTGARIFHQGDDELIGELIHGGMSVQDIAVKWCCMPQNVYWFMKKHGIKTKRQEMKQ